MMIKSSIPHFLRSGPILYHVALALTSRVLVIAVDSPLAKEYILQG